MTDEFTLKKTAKRIKRNHEIARQTGDLSVLKGDPLPHYHHVYNDVPVLNHRFDTIGEAYNALGNMAHRSEPNVKYYEEGVVEFEAKIQGQLKKHWVRAFVAECTSRRCNKKLHPELQKKSGWLP